jgi:tetratricopeptide (TPR) repeat protein
MARDVAEHEDILTLRVIIDHNLRRWSRAGDHLTKLIEKDPNNPGLYNDLANLNFKIRDFASVVDNLQEYFRLSPNHSDTLPYHAMSSALHALGRMDEADAFLDDAVRQNPGLAIYLDEKFLEHQQAALDRGLPAVLLNTLFKSASMYIATRLSEGLNLPRCYITQAVLRGDRIIPSWLDQFAMGGAVCQEHLPARSDILNNLDRAGVDRIVVHTRDPRQSMISGIHHFADMFSDTSYEAAAFVTRLPADYCQLSFSDQADYFLEHNFEQEARWVADWRRIVSEGDFSGRILLTSYEAFRQDNRAYFEALLAFYDIPFELFDWEHIEVEPKKGTLHYRSGETNEWEKVLSKDQISRANGIMLAVGFDPESTGVDTAG